MAKKIRINQIAGVDYGNTLAETTGIVYPSEQNEITFSESELISKAQLKSWHQVEAFMAIHME